MWEHHFRSEPRSVTVAPTWAALSDRDEWRFTLRVWASKARDSEFAEQIIPALANDTDGLDENEQKILAERLADLVADDDSNEAVQFHFSMDPAKEIFQFDKRTNFNGIVLQTFHLPAARICEIAKQQNSDDGWLTIEARCNDVVSEGRIKLLASSGLSVVSDIDDTIRVTEILKGHATVLRNTFLKAFQAVEGMADRYRSYGENVDFHYVSGGPWQLYRVLAPFLINESGFPTGTFHMRNIPKNPFEKESWHAWRDMFTGDSTEDHKKNEIMALLEACPGRRLILIGDSGEKDPEIFEWIRNKYPSRIDKILIRDVRNLPKSPRLKGMTIIPV